MKATVTAIGIKAFGFAALLVACLLVSSASQAQVFQLSKQEMIDYTQQNPFGRFEDGRPKVPDNLLEQAKALSSEDIWAGLLETGYNNQYADGFRVVHPGHTLVGRVFTIQFMPMRPDVHDVAEKKAKERGLKDLYNQTAIDMLQPGDVLVVDINGKKVGGTIVGDNLFYYINVATKGGGLIVDGSVRDLEGISEIDMPAYIKDVDPTPIGNVMITGINVPIRIGNVTVMPGDLAVGDREGIYFIPPQFVKKVLDNADTIHIHDEWTKKKFAEGKYKSKDIYGSPTDPKLKQEYEDYLKKRLEELRKQRENK